MSKSKYDILKAAQSAKLIYSKTQNQKKKHNDQNTSYKLGVHEMISSSHC